MSWPKGAGKQPGGRDGPRQDAAQAAGAAAGAGGIGEAAPAFMLRNLLEHIEFQETRIEQVCAEIEERMGPYQEHVLRGPLPPNRGQARNKRAVIAVAHAILVVVYHCLKDGTIYPGSERQLLPGDRP